MIELHIIYFQHRAAATLELEMTTQVEAALVAVKKGIVHPIGETERRRLKVMLLLSCYDLGGMTGAASLVIQRSACESDCVAEANRLKQRQTGTKTTEYNLSSVCRLTP